MKNLYCDICKKEIDAPIVGKNYFQIREYDVCEPCKDTLDTRLRPILRSHFPYSADWYENQVMTMIAKGVQVNRF